MENGVLETITAFLNSDGGTLPIGVSDDGQSLGLGLEGLPNRDKQQLHLVNLMPQRFGAQFPRFVNLSVKHVDGAEVLRVDCQPSPIPVFMAYENQQRFFYVRFGPSSTELPVGDATEYILREFHADGAGVGG